MSETALSRSIRKALATLGVWCIRVQASSVSVRVHGAEPGTPDLWTPLGWLEVKTLAGELLPSQVAWHLRAAREGVRVATVRSVEQAVRAVREWRALEGARNG